MIFTKSTTIQISNTAWLHNAKEYYHDQKISRKIHIAKNPEKYIFKLSPYVSQ